MILVLFFPLQVAPYRYEPHQGLVDCYIATHRLREASTIATNACKQLNNAPRALTVSINCINSLL